MHLVLGLGNPGQRYAQTRHNVGFLVVDRLAERLGAACDRKQLGSQVGAVSVGGQSVVLAKPQTFMNRSGQAAASLSGYYKVDKEDVVVVHDEVDLPFGELKVKKGGGHAGHNGIRDILAMLKTPDFVRVRVGVGRPVDPRPTADHVLGRWTDTEREALPGLVDAAADAVEHVVTEGASAAMNRVNTRKS